jgi:hypothetical protein
MPRPLTTPEREAFLAEPHIAVLSVASASERPPLTLPIWYGYQLGGNITFFTGTQGRPARKTLPAAGDGAGEPAPAPAPALPSAAPEAPPEPPQQRTRRRRAAASEATS